MKLNNYCEVSPYTNPAERLGALLNFPVPSTYASSDGSERTIVLARNEGAPFIYGGPIDRAAIEQYNAIEVNGVPASVPNSEMVRLYGKCIFRLPFGGGRSFFTFQEFLSTPDCMAGYMIENRMDA